MPARRRRKKNKLRWLPLAGVLFLAAYLLWAGIDQFFLFRKYETAISEKTQENQMIENEIKDLEEAFERKDDLTFIMELARKYGMVPTDRTPTPVILPETTEAPSNVTEETTEPTTEEDSDTE